MIENLKILKEDLTSFDGERKFVLQRHTRGESIHYDLRMLVGESSHLVGLTLNLGDTEKEKQFLKDPTGLQVQVEVKLRQPISWLKVQGEVEPGGIGATRYKPADWKILDSGTYHLGAIKPDEGFFEFFFTGKNDILKGRWITRMLEFPEDREDPKSKKVDRLLFWKPKDQNPYNEDKKK